MTGTALFVDTSIQIARFFHAPELKEKISIRIGKYDITATGLVVRYEFKRRVIREAVYLLQQVRKLKSYNKAMRHITDHLPVQQGRKRNICLEILATILEDQTDEDLTDRAILFLESLIEYGMQDFDDTVDHIFKDSCCACGMTSVRIDAKGKPDLGFLNCRDAGDTCGIGLFLDRCRSFLVRIQEELQKVPTAKMTAELKRIKDFISGYFKNSAAIHLRSPCKHVGDLLIALESRTVPSFYTMNGKESQYLCRILDQDLIVRRRYYTHDDVICLKHSVPWPEF